MDLKIDAAGIGAILRGPEVRKMVDGAAARIQAGARPRAGRGAEVVVEPYETDREAAAVVVKHPKAAGRERKYGILIPAARNIGAEVRPR
jgi:hypothetical protein